MNMAAVNSKGYPVISDFVNDDSRIVKSLMFLRFCLVGQKPV